MKGGLISMSTNAVVAKTKANQARFLEQYAKLGTVKHAAAAAGISPRSHWYWLERDEEYSEAFREAEKLFVNELEAEVRRRALEGIEKPIFQGGKQVGSVREFSDTLLIFMLKGRDPRYKDKVQTEHVGFAGGPLQVKFVMPENYPRSAVPNQPVTLNVPTHSLPDSTDEES